MSLSIPYKGEIKFLTGRIPDFKSLQHNLVALIDNQPELKDNRTPVKGKMTWWKLHEDYPIISNICNHVINELYLFQPNNYKHRHKLTIDQFWAAHYKNSNHALAHDHYPALWSGIIYVKSEGTASPTYFPDCDYRHSADEGTYVVFPGWLKHSVENGSDNRYIFAFNVS